MMDISHLYHDAAFGDPTLELDVKEQLKTREVNAREERNLQRQHRSYDREMGICEKNTAWERWKVGKSLQGIWERSPRLEKRLAMEKARIEALERSILYRNYRMNTDFSGFSMGSRSVTKVNLKPLQDHKRTQQSKTPSKKKDRYVIQNDDNSNNNDNNNNSNNERSVGRQADFVRRSEHSIKTLAKLNWKQQNRRRDHEKFKEDLFFHSKHVFDKAKVVLKGRPDIDVENLYTNLESILLPPVKKSPSLNNSKPQFKNSNSNLYERNVLRLGESSTERKHPPYLSRLPSVSEQLESKTNVGDKTKSKHLENDSKNVDALINNIPTHSGQTLSSSIIGENPETSPHSLKDDTTTTTTTSNTNDITPTNTQSATDNNELPVPSQSTTSNNRDTSESTTAKTATAMPEDSQSNDKLATTNNHSNEVSTGSNSMALSPNHPQQQHQSPPLPTHPFSPSTSISHVIIEENEDEPEEDSNTKSEDGEVVICPDINNNDENVTSAHNREEAVFSAKSNPSDADPGVGNAYAMSCTTGLPQLWKQTTKPKEKAPPEVSASAIARKHKRKRRDRW